MKHSRFVLFTTLAFAAACGTEDIAEPTLDVDAQFAKNQRAACRAQVLAPGTTSGTVSADDCVFTNLNGGEQYEDLYLVNQGRLGTNDGNTMATFSLETEDFNWIYGLGGFQGKEIFPTPVYAFRRGPAGVYEFPSGFSRNTFSIIGGEPMYKIWVGGQDDAQLGDYTLTATANPVTNTCTTGHRVYLQGDVSFSSSITDGTSCAGTVQFGDFIGEPLSFQYWWVRMSPGETITMALDGIQEETTAAAIIDFGGDFVLDLGDGEGDTDRFVSFTAQSRTDIYVEVSMRGGEGRSTPYTMTVDGPDTK